MATSYTQDMYSSKNVFVGAALGLLMATSIGCGTGQNNADTESISCNKVSVEGEDYCVVKQEIIIETGYTCPATFRYRYEVSAMTVCSNRATPPTRPIIFELWRLAYGEEPPPETDMGMVDMPVSDMGGDVDLGQPRSCEEVQSDYASVFDNLPQACQQDADCEALGWQCSISMQISGDVCTASVTVGADVSGLTTLNDEYMQLSCPISECAACPSATYTCDQGMCVGHIEQARTCEDIEAEYATDYAALPQTCQAAADCQSAGVSGCGVTNEVVGRCGFAVSTTSDFSPLSTLNQEYQALGCNLGPDCAECPVEPVDCVNGMCVTTM